MNNIEKMQIESTQITEFIKINHCFFTSPSSAAAHIVKPLRITLDSWTALCHEKLNNEGILTVQCEDNNFELRVKCKSNEIESSHYVTFTFLEGMPETLKNNIIKYTTIRESLEKRSEDRFEVGLKLTEDFGLARRSQIMYTDSKEQIRCIINNVSMSGALITAEYAKVAAGKNIVTLIVEFRDPIETLALKASIVRIDKKTGGFYEDTEKLQLFGVYHRFNAMFTKKNVLFVKFFIANSIATGKVIDFFSGVDFIGIHLNLLNQLISSGFQELHIIIIRIELIIC